MKIQVANGEYPDKRKWLELPITDDPDWSKTTGKLSALAAPGQTEVTLRVKDVVSPVRNLRRNILTNIDPIAISRMSLLAQRISAMSERELQIFSGALDIESINGFADVLRIADMQMPYQHRILVCDRNDNAVIEIADGKLEFPSWEQMEQKNNGERPQYYIQNNHPAIIERDVWNKVQEETARRGCKRKAPSRTARTGGSKYSGKYALSEILVCGECGAHYRRTTWAKPQGRVAMWRCVSRLEHGKKFCKTSPAIPEEALHAAVMGAVSEAILREALLTALTDSVRAAACAETDAAEYQAARLRVGELDRMTSSLIQQSARAGGDEDFYDEKIREIMDERAKWQKIVRDFEAKDSLDRYTEKQVTEAVKMLESDPLLLSEYDDQIVRQLVDTIRVLASDRIMVTLKGGTEIEQRVNV